MILDVHQDITEDIPDEWELKEIFMDEERVAHATLIRKPPYSLVWRELGKSDYDLTVEGTGITVEEAVADACNIAKNQPELFGLK